MTYLLSDFVGQKLLFYGVDGNYFKLGNFIFEAVEDKDDGYRSMCKEVHTVKNTPNLIFQSRHLTTVTINIINQSTFVGYNLIDEDEHVWLRIGTDYNDRYYPYFIFTYRPKEIKKGRLYHF
jgi:hypothetical protein